jgi:hypothetical protein
VKASPCSVRRRLALSTGTGLLAAAACAAVLVTGGGAQAACGPRTACALGGGLGATGAGLSMSSPTAHAWSAALVGLDQQVVDTDSSHQFYLISDSSGSGTGWHVTASATTFTSGTSTLPDAGTLVIAGSVTSEAATTAPTAACAPSSTCTLPANRAVYPVVITTAVAVPAAFTIYDTSAGTGLGTIVVGSGAHPVGWWVNVPASVKAGMYTSTVTLEAFSGP